MKKKRKLISLALIFSFFLQSFSTSVFAREVTNTGIIYNDQETWCDSDFSNVCQAGRVESSACSQCQDGICVLSPTPTNIPILSNCGHLNNNCCRDIPRCFEGNPIPQGLFGLGGCKCLLEGDGVGTLYQDSGCSYAGQEICRVNSIYLCVLENNTLVAKNKPCYFWNCTDNTHCKEFPPPLSPTPTPTPIIIRCDNSGDKRCNSTGTAVQQCGEDLFWRISAICPGGCDVTSLSCKRYCQGNPCGVPGGSVCSTGSLFNCDDNGCVLDYQECLYGCNKSADPNRCTTLEETLSVRSGETFHFNDPLLRWSPIPQALARLFYQNFGGIYTQGEGKAIGLSELTADLHKYLRQNNAYREAIRSTPAALLMLSGLLFLSPYYSPIVIRNIQALDYFTPNVHVSSQITYRQFLENADPKLVREIKLVAQENPDVTVVLSTPQEFEEIFGRSGFWGRASYSGLEGIRTGSGFIPPRTDYVLVGWHAPPGGAAHELGHVLIDRAGLQDQMSFVAEKMGVDIYSVGRQWQEVTATLRAQRFLIEHGFSIPPESTEYLRGWQDKLFEALRGVIRF